MSRGVVTNWDLAESLWSNMLEAANLTNLDSTSILVAQSIKADHQERLALAKLLFEKFHVPSLCLANSAMLSVLASGRTSGLAVECGAGITSTVPVFEGFALKHAVTSMDFGGQDISTNLRKSFFEKGIEIDLQASMFIKEKLAFCNGYKSADLLSTQREKCTFPLPDGIEVTVDSRILRDCTDALFYNPKLPSNGLVSQVQESIVLCDDSIKSELTHNIILSGGNSMLPGVTACTD
jgi:actin, other eukaryote